MSRSAPSNLDTVTALLVMGDKQVGRQRQPSWPVAPVEGRA